MMQGTKRDFGVELYNKKDHSDIIVVLSDGEVYVHKLILVTSCEHFKSMLLGPWADQRINGENCYPLSEKKILDMNRYNPRAFRALLKYVYTGELDWMDGEDLIDLFDISRSYLEDELVTMCSKMFVRTINVNNAAQFYEKASVIKCEELLGHLVEFASRHLDQVIMSEGFWIIGSNSARELVVKATKLSSEKNKTIKVNSVTQDHGCSPLCRKPGYRCNLK